MWMYCNFVQLPESKLTFQNSKVEWFWNYDIHKINPNCQLPEIFMKVDNKKILKRLFVNGILCKTHVLMSSHSWKWVNTFRLASSLYWFLATFVRLNFLFSPMQTIPWLILILIIVYLDLWHYIIHFSGKS